MANMNLVTGYAGENHVTSDDAGACNAAIVGSGQYVMNIGNKFAASAVTNNKVTVSDGVLIMQGRQARIEPGTTVDLAIENGATGYYRNDLIVARYTKNASTGVEEMALVVIKGTASTSQGADPTYTSGDILSGGAIQNDMPLYRIKLEGLTVQQPEQLFVLIDSFGQHVVNKNNPHGVTATQVGAKASGAVEPITNGGTGATTAEGARSNLGAAAASHDHDISVLSGTLPITKGGTGATSAAGALTNLGAVAASHTHTLDNLSNVHISSTTPTSVTNGHWYLVKES